MIELAINTMMADNTIGSHSAASDTISSLLFVFYRRETSRNRLWNARLLPIAHRGQVPAFCPRILWGPSTVYLEPQMAGRVAPPTLSCHPDRRDPAFSSAPVFGVPGLAVERSWYDAAINYTSMESPRLTCPTCRLHTAPCDLSY